MNSARRSLPLLLAAIGTFAAGLPAQSDGLTWVGSRRLYVDPVFGADVAFPTGGGRTAPFLTADFAFFEAQRILNGIAGLVPPCDAPVVINFNPGFYAVAGTLVAPARGLKAQALGPGVILDAGQQNIDVINVNDTGCLTRTGGALMPDTVFQGLTVQHGSIGIRLAVNSGLAVFPDRVVIRQCTIRDNRGNGFVQGEGIRIETTSGRRSEHLVEECEVSEHAIFGTFGIGIRTITSGSGVDTSVIRSNRIHDQEAGIWVHQSGTEAVARHRIFSNLLWYHEQHVLSSGGAGPILVNDTIAFAVPFSNFPSFWGIRHINGGVLGVPCEPSDAFPSTCVVRNCILWNPAVGATPVDELQGNGPFCVSFSDLEDMGTATNVGTLGGNVINRAPVFSGMPTPLHLAATAPQIENGDRALLLPGATLAVGGVAVPIDVGADVDMDPRVLDSDRLPGGAPTAMPERGGDERLIGAASPNGISAVRLSIGGADAFGNLVYNGAASLNVTFSVQARPGDAVSLHAWFACPGGPLDPNYVNAFVDPFGNLLISACNLIFIASGAADPAGVFSLTVPIAHGANEGIVWFQALAVQSVSPVMGDLSNVRPLETNE